jgi:hypothetical protein
MPRILSSLRLCSYTDAYDACHEDKNNFCWNNMLMCLAGGNQHISISPFNQPVL